MREAQETTLAWLIPLLLTSTLGVLGWMAININKISEALAVVVYQIGDHESRLDRLEWMQDGRSPPRP